MTDPSTAKVCSPGRLAQAIARLPRPLVFTNGVFDVLHRGHVSCLLRARALGASLLVGVNTDASARRLGKGAGRPFNREHDRAAVVSALEPVSLVALFDEDAPLELIRLARPDVYVKGDDYRIDGLAEAQLVRSWQGRALTLPRVGNLSTTALVERIRGAAAPSLVEEV
jgi:rfaE bifunctional protein nucleotidyltransferase chain/domain